jgi:Uma2 family endonuclease
MDPAVTMPPAPDLIYPDSDGLPIGENTKHVGWIFKLYYNLTAMFSQRDDVFVAADLFWYPEEGRPDIRLAPDVLVALGRPKGDRGSYKQWEEGGVPPTVVFEVLPESDRVTEMLDKLAFYEERGVEELYVYDPHANCLTAFLRNGGEMRLVRQVHGFVSPRLGIRFELAEPELVIRRPDGWLFLSPEESAAAHNRAEEAAERFRREADQSHEKAERARQQLARMKELARKALRGQATAEELRELEQLGDDVAPPAALIARSLVGRGRGLLR